VSVAGEVVQPLTGLRRTIATRMVRAWEAPVFHVTVSIDISSAQHRRRKVTGASLTDELIRCSARALMKHPQLNAHFKDDAIHLQPMINVGLAVARDEGLIVPVLQDVGGESLAAIASRRREIVERARTGALSSADVAHGTFTISNLGMFGVDRFDALLNLPQVAILAVGGAIKRLVFDEGVVVEREFIDLTLTSDHRAVDGAAAAAFLRTLKIEVETV
jgi:pyruvate dehydrogenase E2 component (dihydrolipoamide acetyltransferase)